MPFKVTYGQLRDDAFNGAIEKLIGFRDYNDHQVSYNVAKINRKLEDEHKVMRDSLDTLTKKFVKTDEKGNYIWKDGIVGRMEPIDDDHHERYNEELQKFDAVEVEIPCHKLDFAMVAERVKLSPQEIGAILSMLTEPAEKKPVSKGKTIPIRGGKRR